MKVADLPQLDRELIKVVPCKCGEWWLGEGRGGGDDQPVVHVADEEMLAKVVAKCWRSSWKVCSHLISCRVMGMLARMGEIWLPMPVPCIYSQVCPSAWKMLN